jgi:hypothetical protein
LVGVRVGLGSWSRRVRKGSGPDWKRTVNRTIYLFGPIVIFAGFLYAWSVLDPSSYNGMIEALRKFFGAWKG